MLMPSTVTASCEYIVPSANFRVRGVIQHAKSAQRYALELAFALAVVEGLRGEGEIAQMQQLEHLLDDCDVDDVDCAQGGQTLPTEEEGGERGVAEGSHLLVLCRLPGEVGQLKS